MGLGNLNKVILRGGLSIAAALLLSSAAFAQEATTGDDHVVVQNWHDLNPAGGDEGIAVGEPDPNAVDEGIAVGEPDPNGDGSALDPTDDTAGDDDASDGGPDIVIDDGQCVGEDCALDEGTGPVEGDGEVVIYYMNGGPDACIDCNVTVRGTKANERSNHGKVERAPTTTKQDSSDAVLSLTTSMAQCLSAHARSAWICEWQNGAGQ